MSEDVMVAFRRYIKREDDLKGIEYEFEELLHECLNMDNYFKIFHHFNFTVKIKKCGSADWTPMTFFAEVILILQTKYYECYPLDPDDYGQCYACQKQGMRELRHPSADIFECGKRDTTFPYYYKDSDTTFPYYYEDIDSDESYPIVGGSESDCDMS